MNESLTLTEDVYNSIGHYISLCASSRDKNDINTLIPFLVDYIKMLDSEWKAELSGVLEVTIQRAQEAGLNEYAVNMMKIHSIVNGNFEVIEGQEIEGHDCVNCERKNECEKQGENDPVTTGEVRN